MVMSSREHPESRICGLIGDLYDAALDAALWPDVAQRLAGAMASSSVVLKLQGHDGSVRLLACSENLIVPERDRAWAEDWHRKDLWVERSVAFGMSRTVTGDELVSPAEQERSGFYQEWLRHLGIHHMIGAVLPFTDRSIGVLGLHRSRGAGPYAPAERRQFERVLQHLPRALRVGQRLAERTDLQSAAVEALDRLDTGVILVDGTCRIVHASAMALTLLRQNTVLAVVDGCLRPRAPTLQNRLQSLVRATTGLALGTLAELGQALSVPRPHRMPLALEFAPVRPSTRILGEQQPACLIFIRDPQAPIAIERLRDLFGLTLTEGAVAAALGSGHSVEGIAGGMGIGVATVRTHLKRILAKTGTHRQAEVVTLLARSVSTGNAGR
ncbi:MAG TPA: helix-turn-helix transcriptional regulator [Methylibium sp.]|nr:helix-turn-helix transcriptional regulator [Methylibium sp.]